MCTWSLGRDGCAHPTSYQEPLAHLERHAPPPFTWTSLKKIMHSTKIYTQNRLLQMVQRRPAALTVHQMEGGSCASVQRG